MSTHNKTKEELINELQELKQKYESLKASVIADSNEREQVEQALHESQKRLNEAHQLAHIGLWDWDANSDVVNWSEELYQIAGFDPKLPAPSFTEQSNIYTPQSWQLLKTAVESTMKTGELYQLELELIRPDGKLRNVNAFGGAKFDDLGQITGLFGTLQDITERKMAEEAIRASEEKYRLLYSAMDQGLALHEIITDENGKPIDYVFLDINDSYTRLLGVTREMSIGKRIREVMPKVEEYWIDIFGKVALTGEPNYYENYLETTGKYYSTYSYSPKKNQFAVLVNDITERKLAEAEFRLAKEKAEESENKYRKMVENMNSGVAIYQPINDGKDFKFIDFNKAAERITNTTVNDVAGNTLLSQFPNMDKSPLFMALQNVYQLGKDIHIPPFFYKDKQREGWRENYIYKLPSGEIVAIFDDVTERINAQIKLQNQNFELSKAKEKAEASDRIKTAFLQNMSHEIRTPMNSIMGFASLLPEEEDKNFINNYSEIIYKNAEQLVHVIDDIVVYSQLQNKQFTFIPKEFDANILIQDIKLSFNLPEYQKGVTLQVKVPVNNPVIIYSDYDKIRQVFTNLIANAFKYTNEGTIAFGIDTKENELLFFVKDTGIGIPKLEANKIFDRFYRASNVNKSAINGTGLGLSIVKELIELLGGKIWVESNTDGELSEIGSTFYFTLPIVHH